MSEGENGDHLDHVYQRRAKPCKRGTFLARKPSKSAGMGSIGGPNPYPMAMRSFGGSRTGRRIAGTIGANRPKPRPTGDFRCVTPASNYTPKHVSADFRQTFPLIEIVFCYPSDSPEIAQSLGPALRPEIETTL